MDRERRRSVSSCAPKGGAAHHQRLACVAVALELDVGTATGARRTAALALCAVALLYQVLALASGLSWPRMPSYGVPCPTAILTAGVLMCIPLRRRQWLAVIPLGWCAVGGSAAILLGVIPDYALLAAGALLLFHLVTSFRRGGREDPIEVSTGVQPRTR
jgi:hypothetical protein